MGLIPSLSLTRAERYKTQNPRLIMKEERCRRYLSGYFRPTLNPNELKCNYCGWTRIAMNLGDYVAYGGKVDNFHKLN